jgi:hypothetical protein
MESIKDVVRSLLEDLSRPKAGAKEGSPEDWLKKVLTKRELAHIKFNYFKKGTLGVWVDSSSWLYSLSIKKAQLLTRMQGEGVSVKDLRFRIGEIR